MNSMVFPDFPIHFPIATARPWGIACPEHPRRRGGASSGALPGDPLAGATQPGAGTWRVLVYHGTVDLYGNSWGYNGKCGNSQEFPGDEWGFSWGSNARRWLWPQMEPQNCWCLVPSLSGLSDFDPYPIIVTLKKIDKLETWEIKGTYNLYYPGFWYLFEG